MPAGSFPAAALISPSWPLLRNALRKRALLRRDVFSKLIFEKAMAQESTENTSRINSTTLASGPAWSSRFRNPLWSRAPERTASSIGVGSWGGDPPPPP